MAADASAYAALGLEPGADPGEIERAYKRLIKLHHPDREGGDGDRAAEINRAYRQLSNRFAAKPALDLADDHRNDRGGGWVKAAMTLIIVLAALFVLSGPVTAYVRSLVPAASRPNPGNRVLALATRPDPMDRPLDLAQIARDVREVQHIRSRSGDAGLVDASRACHRELRLHPSVAQLDRCAAFDDAVVQLENRDPMWDQGPFSQVAVTSRQWSAASALSNDYLAIDGRLDRIRLQVELASAPVTQPIAAEPTQATAN